MLITDENHDYMIEAIEEEAGRIGRNLSWDEATQFLLKFLSLSEEPEDGSVHDWLSSTDVPVSSYQVEGTVGVAWGNFETEQDAEHAVKDYQSRTGRTYLIAFHA